MQTIKTINKAINKVKTMLIAPINRIIRVFDFVDDIVDREFFDFIKDFSIISTKSTLNRDKSKKREIEVFGSSSIFSKLPKIA